MKQEDVAMKLYWEMWQQLMILMIQRFMTF